MVAIGPDGTPIDMGAIVQMLQDGVDRVEGFEPAQVPERRFGTLGNGTALGHHTELARRAVREAILTMVHDLQHYSEGVETFRKGFNVADQHAQEDLAHIAAQVGSVRSATDGGLDR